MMKLTPLKYWKNGHAKLKTMSQNVFFSDLFAIILDAYFEFSICCYYNLVFEIDPKLIDVIGQSEEQFESEFL